MLAEETPAFVHPTACVDDLTCLAAGARVWHFCHVMAGARVGEGTQLGQNVFVGDGATIGARCKVQNNVSVYGGVVLEDDVFCGPSCVFTNVRHPRAEISRRGSFEVTRIGRGATLGANATIVCGVSVGRFAFVGAGAVVTHDVPDYGMVVGVPARLVGFVGRHGEPLEPAAGDTFRCPASGWTYRRDGSGALRCDDWPEATRLP